MIHITDHDLSKAFGIVLPHSKVTKPAGNHRAAQTLANDALRPTLPVSSQTKMGFSLSAEICVVSFVTDTILSDTARKAGITQAAHSRVQKTQDHSATTETASLDISMLTRTSAQCSIQDRSLMTKMQGNLSISPQRSMGLEEHKASMLLLKKELQNNKSALLDTSAVPFCTRFQANTDIIRLRFHSSFSQSHCWLSQSHSLPPTGFRADLTRACWQHYINRKPTLLQKKKCFLPVWSLSHLKN